MTEEQRARAHDAMQRMLNWALTRSLQPDGSFAPDENFFSSLSSDFYFGVLFVDEVGYWQKEKRFWTDESFPGAEAKCLLIRNRLVELRLQGPLAAGAEEKLQDSCGLQ